MGGEGRRVEARGREGSQVWKSASSSLAGIVAPVFARSPARLAVGRAMVFVRKCASDCRLKYDSHPIRSRPARPRDCHRRSRPSSREPDGRTEESLGVCLAQRPLYYAAVQAHASVRRSIEPSPPRRSLDGSSTFNRWWHHQHRKQQADRGTDRGREATCRSTDPQTQRLRKCASPSPGQRPARIVSVSRCKAFAQFLALQVKFHRMRVPKLGHA